MGYVKTQLDATILAWPTPAKSSMPGFKSMRTGARSLLHTPCTVGFNPTVGGVYYWFWKN